MCTARPQKVLAQFASGRALPQKQQGAKHLVSTNCVPAKGRRAKKKKGECLKELTTPWLGVRDPSVLVESGKIGPYEISQRKYKVTHN